MQGKGQKKLRNIPVLYDEVKKPRTLNFTPTAWDKLLVLSKKAGLSASEYLEQVIRETDVD